MMQEIIQVAKVINSPLGITAEDGQKVFDRIRQGIVEGKHVTISFDNITMLISLFLNVAIGQLYGCLKEETIRGQLKVEGLSSDDMELLKRVIENAKKYYANKKSYDEAWQEMEQ
ncbi:STAS-like domain-containing protein [uncultured Desulfovibrio sp.]|uniref:STAS-like domain-containing protein n=1 Tax=uncultured Desulfovibrio sp. TaxID=167968 RepID=UPI0026081929|nr:STAS-like domain-containing protein [uncultured Desulfovibrio sp.]